MAERMMRFASRSIKVDFQVFSKVNPVRYQGMTKIAAWIFRSHL
jgi:hypothetical protein